jgi:hypothetical protein
MPRRSRRGQGEETAREASRPALPNSTRCVICSGTFREGRRRVTCSNENCGQPFIAHYRCIELDLREHTQVKIRCNGCGKKHYWRSKTNFKVFEWYWNLLGVVVALAVILAPFWFMIYWTDGKLVPGGGYTLTNMAVYAALFWGTLMLLWACLDKAAHCCCWPMFSLCRPLRKHGKSNYS